MTTSSPPPTWRLAEHVRACRIGNQMIFLDLLRSRYVGIGGTQVAELASLLEDRTPAETSPGSYNSTLLDAWIRRLGDQHLLSKAKSESFTRGQPSPIECVSCLDMDGTTLSTASNWRHLVGLWWAMIAAATWLRRFSLADIADRVVALRARHAKRSKAPATDEMQDAMAAYLRWRPFVLTTHDRCLNDSLTLIHFLARRGLFPQWVIGVRVHPFSAHSWVQSGETVLNDLPENVRRYTPILVV